MATLREGLANTINELNKLLVNARDEETEAQIRKIRRVYFALFEEVIKQEIDNRTLAFREAISELAEARSIANEAKQDVEKISLAINRALIAARAVDNVVKLGIHLAA